MSGTTEPNAVGKPIRRLVGKWRRPLRLALFISVLCVVAYAIMVSISRDSQASGTNPLAEASGIETGGPLVGKPVPAFKLPAVNSALPDVSPELYQGKPIVINFFASWCTPCQKELPEFARIAESSAGNVQFIGVDENDSRGPAQALLTKAGAHYPAAYDADGRLTREYHLLGLPTTIFIASNGTVINEVAGQITPAVLNADLGHIAAK